ncbi:MAG: class I SAM-dependent methyltransferase [Candidatus Angelobacter sp.]
MARPYFATEPWLFEQIMQAVALSIQQSALSIQPTTAVRGTSAYTGLQEFNFIDLGSGKGRVLLMAADYPFKRIIGVELMPKLHRAAQENIAKYPSERQCRQIKSICMDARDFEFPDGPLVVYLFNPFSESTFALILKSLRTSVEQAPRPVYVAYRFTEFENLLVQAKWLEKIAGAKQWAIYQNKLRVEAWAV